MPAALLAVTFTYWSTEVPMPTLPLMTAVVGSRLRPGGNTPLVPITRFLMVWTLVLLAPVVPVKLNAQSDLSAVSQGVTLVESDTKTLFTHTCTRPSALTASRTGK